MRDINDLNNEVKSKQAFELRDKDVDGTTIYVGMIRVGDWKVERYVTTGDALALRVATSVNNPDTATYNDAWSNRATLTYE